MFETGLHNALRRHFTRGMLRVAFPSGRIETYGNGASPASAVRIADGGALRRIAFDPALGVPEMYMDGGLVLEAGDILDLLTLAKLNAGEKATPVARLHHLRRRMLRGSPLRAIGIGRARANAAHHYDLDERLYRLFLDRDMQYSCAWFDEPALSLDAAQLAKKRLIAAKLLLRPGAHVLDIGSGWGGMALYLARVCDAEVTGVTLSAEQLRVATARAEAAGVADRVRFRLQDYREIPGRFDAVVSVGMFEHVGLRRYGAFFATARRLLEPDGVMLLHSIAQKRASGYAQPFIERYIFPGGFVPGLSQVIPAVERSGLLIRDIEILTLHYAETLKEWRRRFLAARDRVLELYDERFLRMWDLYLAGFEAAFRVDALHVAHLQLALDQERVPLTRAYIEEAMAGLRAREAMAPDYAALHEAAPAPLRRRASS